MVTDDYSQEMFNIGVAFHQKVSRNKLSSPNPSRNYLIGMVVTYQSKCDMVIKIATHTFIGKSLDKFSSASGVEFIMSLWVWLKVSLDSKIMNVLFKDVVPMAQEKQNNARG